MTIMYAVNNGRKYDIINIDDPKNPKTVGVFELDTPSHSIHDVWIQDGIAYSSNWSDGIVAVDIGSNASADLPGAGGSPENPVQLGSYAYPSGWNHAAFPFKSESTGDFYVLGGDEAFPYGLNTEGANRAAGWIHFVKFDDWILLLKLLVIRFPKLELITTGLKAIFFTLRCTMVA